MTREEAKKAAEVMMTYADGKEIEFNHKSEKDWESSKDYLTIGFDFVAFDYRINQEPPYRPFKDKDECWAEMQKHQPFGWLKYKDDSKYVNIIGLCGKEVELIPYQVDRDSDIVQNLISFHYIFQTYAFADGTPFGIKGE